MAFLSSDLLARRAAFLANKALYALLLMDHEQLGIVVGPHQLRLVRSGLGAILR
jgi:hypothetical protein